MIALQTRIWRRGTPRNFRSGVSVSLKVASQRYVTGCRELGVLCDFSVLEVQNTPQELLNSNEGFMRRDQELSGNAFSQ